MFGNNLILSVAALLLGTQPLWAYHMNVDCSIRATAGARVDAIDISHQVGAERIECASDQGGIGLVRVIRKVKSASSVNASGGGRAEGSASASYDATCHSSCWCSGSSYCSGPDRHHHYWNDSCDAHCQVYGRGSDSCSGTGSDRDSRSQSRETVFVVARASPASLQAKGFKVRQGSHSCEILDPRGSLLDPLRAIAVVSWIHGQELMKEQGADFSAHEKLSPALKKDPQFD